MANNNPPLKTPATTPLSADQISLDMDMSELAKYEKYITIKQGLRAEEEREAHLAEERRARDAGIQSTRQKMAQDALNQSMCGHKKENGRTHLMGQRDHSGVLHLICQRCQAPFLGSNVPFDLRPDMDMVGGPNN